MPEDYAALTVRIPRALHEDLRRLAYETRQPMAQFVVLAVQEFVDNFKSREMTESNP